MLKLSTRDDDEAEDHAHYTERFRAESIPYEAQCPDLVSLFVQSTRSDALDSK